MALKILQPRDFTRNHLGCLQCAISILEYGCLAVCQFFDRSVRFGNDRVAKRRSLCNAGYSAVAEIQPLIVVLQLV